MSSSDIDNIFDNAASGKILFTDRHKLTIDYVPEKLPFRDGESRTLAQVLSTAFKGARPSNLLLFGIPGTGKTAVVKNVVERWIKKARELGVEVVVPVVNAKLANSPYKVLFEIAEEIGINREQKGKVHFTGLSMGEATDRILLFIQKKKLHVIMVIDEIDSLIQKSGDDILYSFTRANQRMINGGFISLIGISNSIDFKDRLDPRVRSSLSEEEVVFNPYSVQQLRHILEERAKVAFREGAASIAAINLCAAIAGREHGDARKAINLLRVSAELAEREGASKVDENHVRAAQEKIEKDTPYEILKNAPTHTKLVTLAVARSKGGNTGQVYTLYSAFCKKTGQEPLTQRRITQIISELDLLGLVTSEVVSQGRYGRSQKITITMPPSTIMDALELDSIVSGVIAED
ncbi:MAG: AAA family ATPase [Nitrososphaera sp.]|nr:AAA family ATPase [Nitrososphaera sp.]